MSCLSPAGSRSAAPGRPSPGSRTPRHTGAGDVFGAAFVLGTLDEWPLRQRLAFANLCAALSVQYVGGSLAAPGWGDIIDWLARTRAKAAGGSTHAAELAKGYEFITDVLPESGRISVRRARATIARISDAETHRRRG